MAETACHLAGIAGPGTWSAAAVEGVLRTIDTRPTHWEVPGQRRRRPSPLWRPRAATSPDARASPSTTTTDRHRGDGDRRTEAAEAARDRAGLPGHPHEPRTAAHDDEPYWTRWENQSLRVLISWPLRRREPQWERRGHE